MLIVAVGNELRSDDGVGPYIATALISSNSANMVVINAGQRPEDAIYKACSLQPSKTVIIDAAMFNGAPGEARIIPEDMIPNSTLSTHSVPLSIVSRFIAQDTGRPVYFVGIQTEHMRFGEGLSHAVKQTADHIISMLQSRPA
ncbi:MAG: hydrogenase maturation peptidase HycI [Nitrospiraceae bacterium]|nr:hydrogenase maturation peptidase HycI [Nitrospiraceae bacterium]